jgi:hypothetical protein
LQLGFAGMLVVGFVLFAAQLKWMSYNSRLHTPWFVLALAWAAVMVRGLGTWGRRGLLGLLAVAALPNALLNYTRPLLTLPEAGVTPRPSVLSIPRNLEYFLYWPHLAAPYLDAALRIAERECADVGVRAWPDAWVYPIFVLSRSAGSTAGFRNVDVTNPTARFAGPPRTPCVLLQLGPDAGTPPAWASHWSRVTGWNAQLGLASVAVFAPPP